MSDRLLPGPAGAALLPLTLVLLLVVAAPATAAPKTIFRCEADGQVTYTNAPCAGARALGTGRHRAAAENRSRCLGWQRELAALQARLRDGSGDRAVAAQRLDKATAQARSAGC
ncbi:DUF4124 domain-containing protein [Rubrivivax sp. RP6-9]|uniref:DUF4124 domain-containing protein n=1 Tax=Rubrivivax sp. RP6-9 TaxID=3415750 RepID=UPI003CC59A66